MSRYNWALAQMDEYGDILNWDHGDGCTAADLDEVMG
jgi:hypothetical protein